MGKITVDDLRGKSADELEAVASALETEARDLHQTGDGVLRDKSAEEQAEFDRLLDVRDEAVKRAGQLREVERIWRNHPRATETAFQGVDDTGRGGRRSNPTPFTNSAAEVLRLGDADVRDRALRALEVRGRGLPADQADQVDGLLRQSLSESNPYFDGSALARRLLISESDAYRSAFTEVMTNPHPILTAEEADAVRAMRRLDAVESRGMAESSGPVGAFGLPVLIDPSIMLSSGAGVAPILDIARVVPTNTNIWKGVSSAPPQFSWDTEGTAVSDDSPTLAQPAITVYTTRGFIPYSIEVGMDYPNFATEMSDLLAAGYLDIMASATAVGTGVAQPFGVFTKLDATPASEIVVTTFAQLGAVDVFKLWNALPERFRPRASWVMSVSAESQIRSFSSANQSSAYFTVDLTADGLSRLNGRPVTVTDYAPAFVAGSAGHQNYVVVGDFKSYVVARRSGLAVEPINHLFDTTTGRPLGQRGFFAFARAGADCSVTNAFRLLNTT
jgi:HK97 family phage major capsid protein